MSCVAVVIGVSIGRGHEDVFYLSVIWIIQTFILDVYFKGYHEKLFTPKFYPDFCELTVSFKG